MRLALLFTAGTAVSAAVMPRASAPVIEPPVTFSPVSLEDAKAAAQSSSEDSPSIVTGAVGSVAAAAAGCSNPAVRVEWQNFATADRLALIAAIKCLMGKPPSGKFTPSKNMYEDFSRLHQWYMPNVHQNANFLVWHRYYLWVFEQTLKKQCGMVKPLPWWDETLVAGRFSQQDLFTDQRYFGHLIANPDGSAHCISSGAFSNMVCNIGPGQTNTPHCLSRAVNGQVTSQVTADYVNTCNARTSYVDMASCQETGVHALGHNGIGGVMSDVSAAPEDPIFWLHHGMIDRNFRLWQDKNPTVRTTSINGADVNGKPLSMSYVIAVSSISGFPNIPIGNIMDTMSGKVMNGVQFCYVYNR